MNTGNAVTERPRTNLFTRRWQKVRLRAGAISVSAGGSGRKEKAENHKMQDQEGTE